MPLVLSQNNSFRGMFSVREKVIAAIAKLMSCAEADLENHLIIRCPNGQIRFEKEDGSVDRFCKFNYPLICRELKAQTRVAIFDKDGKESIFAIWITAMNEIYYSPNEVKEVSENSLIEEITSVEDSKENDPVPEIA